MPACAVDAFALNTIPANAASIEPFNEASEAGETVAKEANHEKKGTVVEAGDQATGDLWIEGSTVSGFVNLQDSS